MTAQEKKLLQDVIDDVHSQFIKAVAEGRNLPEADVRAIADGRIFTGNRHSHSSSWTRRETLRTASDWREVWRDQGETKGD
jgi:protease-4